LVESEAIRDAAYMLLADRVAHIGTARGGG
jgi:hypothetical protein